MKSDWNVRQLKELCLDYKNDIVDGPFGSNLKREDYRDKGIPVLKIQNIKPYAITLKKMDYVDEEKYLELQRHSYRNGDIIMTKLGDPLGASAIVDDHQKGLIVADLVRIRAVKINTRYLCYHLNSPLTNDFINGLQQGATRPRVQISAVRELPIFVPPLAEQKRIVAILDEAFEGIAAAKANAEKNLANARELFEGYLKAVFGNETDFVAKSGVKPKHIKIDESSSAFESVSESHDDSRTGGRAASTGHIPGNFSLSVGMPKFNAKKGWNWQSLTSLARMESGHTPSRRHPEYWGGDVSWVGIRDAKRFHGLEINETEQHTNHLGLANSSARLLPKGTVCLSRTASVGYVTILGKPMATSQDFVNWVCGKKLNPCFLQLLLMAQGEEIFKFSTGAVHQTIYFPEAKAFHICVPNVDEQANIVSQAALLKEESENLERIYNKKLIALAELKQSILQKAFAGELTSTTAQTLPDAAE